MARSWAEDLGRSRPARNHVRRPSRAWAWRRFRRHARIQPLRRIDDPTERSWAAEWIAALLAHEKVAVTPDVKDAVWSALNSLASAPVEERTLTGLALLLQSNALRIALGA
jgi:type IV secretory pathway VirB4 component